MQNSQLVGEVMGQVSDTLDRNKTPGFDETNVTKTGAASSLKLLDLLLLQMLLVEMSVQQQGVLSRGILAQRPPIAV